MPRIPHPQRTTMRLRHHPHLRLPVAHNPKLRLLARPSNHNPTKLHTIVNSAAKSSLRRGGPARAFFFRDVLRLGAPRSAVGAVPGRSERRIVAGHTVTSRAASSSSCRPDRRPPRVSHPLGGRKAASRLARRGLPTHCPPKRARRPPEQRVRSPPDTRDGAEHVEPEIPRSSAGVLCTVLVRAVGGRGASCRVWAGSTTGPGARPGPVW